MNTAIVVPARLQSQRFPRKLLQTIQGKPLVLYTAERVREEYPELPLYFAVAEEEISTVLASAGFTCVMTDPDLPSGTDRLAQANEEIGADFVINIQADEPLVTHNHIDALHRGVDAGVDIVTLGVPLASEQEFFDPNRVKVISGERGNALYFSRAPIPHFRGKTDFSQINWASYPARLHLGMYGYKKEFLQQFSQLPTGQLEQLEKLEQLRALENGYSIHVVQASQASIGIDTKEDFDRFTALIEKQST